MDMADPRSLIDTYSVYIDGQWVDPDRAAGAGGRYDDVCPATEAVIASAPDPSQAQVDSAIAAARNAFDSGPWADAGPEQRAGFLNQLGEALLAHADEFFALAQQEWGCTANERVIHVEGPAFAALNAAGLLETNRTSSYFSSAQKLVTSFQHTGAVARSSRYAG
jgi:aldehyde dehydrogenase (NAD+)